MREGYLGGVAVILALSVCSCAGNDAGGSGAGGVSGMGGAGASAGGGGVAGAAAGAGAAGAAGSGGSAAAGGSAGTATGGGASGSGGGGGTATGGSAGAGSGGSGGGCPSGAAPTGPFNSRFDVATLNCNASGSCSGSEDKCFCNQDFDALNGKPPHVMAVGTDKHKQKIWNAGNNQGVYIDDLNTNWSAGGQKRANDVHAAAQAAFPCGLPSWFIVNEISAGQWPGNAAYRQFVIDFAKTLSGTFKRKVVIASPFDKPGANGASWTELAKYAFIGAEVYLSGKEINATGNSVAWCQAQYQASITAYQNRGVAKNRLFIFEHFANTNADVGWGRAGVSTAGWHNAIKARSQALKNLNLAGFVSYGWGGNAMHAPQSDRLSFMQTYVAQDLP